MRETISQMMDGELAGGEAARALAALRSGGEARDAWRVYHLIGDSLRETRALSHGFTERVAARLAEEPTVFAPAPESRPLLHAWPRAAVVTVALGFVVLAAMMVSGRGPLVEPARVAQLPESAAVQAPEAATEPARSELPEGTRDYLLAHQGYSPRHALQGYARTVSDVVSRRP